MPELIVAASTTLPTDPSRATLVGRVWRPGLGPSVVVVRDGDVFDATRGFPTVRDVCEHARPADAVRDAIGERLCELEELLRHTPRARRDPTRAHLLAPVDLQAIKAAGVTFAASLLERVIEEHCRGDAAAAASVRASLTEALGQKLANVVPGSEAARRLKALLLARGLWSQYLEVGIGPDAEIFTKAQPMSAVGHGAEVGIAAGSEWNNPEPELVLVASSTGAIVGATLGNDVNLRDVEGRSALLLGRAKDNNASCALGPFVRLFDRDFGLDDLRTATISMTIRGDDGFVLEGRSPLAAISRTPEELVAQTCNAERRFPDGFVLFLGTMFAPVADRGEPGRGFTHHAGDVVEIACPPLGCLANRVVRCATAEPWTYGTRALMASLAYRGLL